jgi:hypothetical protein
MEDYAVRATTGAITVAATPFTSKDKLKDTLTSGDAYLDNQVLPIQLLVRNDGPEETLFRVEALRLVWADGAVRSPLTPGEVYAAVKSSVAAGAIFGGVLGASAVSTQNEHKMRDITSVALQDASIAPGASLTGFAFFPLKKTDASLKGSTLRVVLRTPGNPTDTVVELALEGDLPKP